MTAVATHAPFCKIRILRSTLNMAEDYDDSALFASFLPAVVASLASTWVTVRRMISICSRLPMR
jgi:ABC-type Mn2+/Zn2+ transport system permease subunit